MSGPTLVGRDHELADLQALLNRSVAGSGGTVLLIAEPGGGKTRLAREAGAIAEAKGMVVGWSIGMEATSAVPLLPVVEAMNNALARQDLDRLRSHVRPAHHLAALVVPQLFLDVALPEHLEDAAKPMLFEAVLEVLGLLGDSAPAGAGRRALGGLDDPPATPPLHHPNAQPSPRGRHQLAPRSRGQHASSIRTIGTARSLGLRPLSAADIARLGER